VPSFDLDGRLALLRTRLRRDPTQPPRVWVRRHWPWLTLLGLAIAGVAFLDVWLVTCGFTGCPSAGEIRAFRPDEGGRILDRNGRLIGRLASIKRVNVPLSDVPPHVRAAFIATEDRRFFRHHGVDWRGSVRAVVRNVSAFQVREGFSTITMQVARNTFLARRWNGRSFKRKLVELRMARLIEKALTKDQILELYLNVIYLGNGVHGVEAASRDLFGKSVARVNIAEGAMLAALPKAPSVYTPRRNRKRAQRRRDLVLQLMVREGYLPQRMAMQAVDAPLRVAEREWRPNELGEPTALDAVRALVDSVAPDAQKEGDITVYTTLDATAQAAADRAVARHAAAIDRSTRGAPVQGALVALDPHTGDIRALVSGRRVQRGGFNRAIAAHRQPGSAFKPFVYAAALDAGHTPATLVDDEPIELRRGGQVWAPRNYDDQYLGRTTMRRALMKSANAATVRFAQSVGEARVVAVAHRSGIRSKLPAVPSISLGAVEVTPLELVTAYAPFANGGLRVKPRLVRRIEAADGTPLWSIETEREAVMDPRTAFQITSMLQGVVNEGTGTAIRNYGVRGPVAGKTGTTNNGTDVWFVGYTPSLVAGIWFGHDTPRPLGGGASGGRLAAPAWADFYLRGWRGRRDEAFVVPAGLAQHTIDPETGDLAGEYCPHRDAEWFRLGTEPQQWCRVHVAPQFEEERFPDDAPPGSRGGRNGDAGGGWMQDVGKRLGKIFGRIRL